MTRATFPGGGCENREKVKILHDLLDRGELGATSRHFVGICELDPVESLFLDLLSMPGALAAPNAPAPGVAYAYLPQAPTTRT